MVTIKNFPLFSYKGKQEQLLVAIMTITYKKKPDFSSFYT